MKANKINIIIIMLLVPLLSFSMVNITPPEYANASNITTNFDSEGRLYSVFQDTNNSLNRGKMMRYDGFNWKNILTNISVLTDSDDDDNITEHFTTNLLAYSDLKFDSRDNLYVMYGNQLGSNTPLLNVQKYNTLNQEWVNYNGSSINTGLFENSTPTSFKASIDINSSDTPFVAYIDSTTDLVNVVYLNFMDVNNEEDDAWRFLVNSIGMFSSTEVSLSIVYDIPYLAYINSSTNKISVSKYINSEWVNVQENLSTGDASNIKIYQGSDFNIYIIYNDSGENGDAVLKKLTQYDAYSVEEGSTFISQLNISTSDSVTYLVSGDDSSFFEVSADGNLSFSVARDFDTPLDVGTNNIYEANVTVTNLDSKSISRSVKVTVTPIPVLPTFSASLSPSTVGEGVISTLTYRIDNSTTSSGSSTQSGITFSTTLPTGMIISGSSAVSDCADGVISATDGSNTFSLSDARLGLGSSCTFSIDIVSSTSGAHNIVSSDLSMEIGSVNSSTATLTVDGSRPGFSKIFSPTLINVGDQSTLTYTIDNSSNPSNANVIRFAEILPSGLTVAQNPNPIVSIGCGGVEFISEPNSNSISATVFSLSTGATCTLSVDVVSDTSGLHKTVSGTLTQNYSNPSGTAIAYLEVVEPGMAQSFLKKTVSPGESVTLQFTLKNESRTDSMTNITFTEDLNSVLSGLSATALPANNFCGSGSTLTGTTNITIAGASLSPESSCSFGITVLIPSGAAAGNYTATSSIINANIDSIPVTLSSLVTTLRVLKFPILTKSFIDAHITAGQNTTIRYTITNTDTANDITAMAFSDVVSDVEMSVVQKPNANTCGTGSTFTTNVDYNGLLLFDIADASLSAGASCTFDLVVTIPDDFVSGSYPTTASTISGTVSGSTLYNTAVSETLVISSAPKLTLSLDEDVRIPGDDVVLQFSLKYPTNALADATSINFTADLDSILSGLVSTTDTLNDMCGSGSSFSGTSTLNLSGASLSPGEECDFNITVSIPVDAVMGSYDIVTNNPTATVSSSSVSSGVGSVNLLLSGLRVSHVFGNQSVFPGESVVVTFKIENIGSLAATDIELTDRLSQSLSSMSAITLPTSGFCGVNSVISGTTSLTATSMELEPGTSCEFDVTVLIPNTATQGEYNNATSDVTATVNTVNTTSKFSTAYFEIPDYLSVVSEFDESTAKPDDNITMRIVLKNNHLTKGYTTLDFTDDLSSILDGLTAIEVTSNSCNGSVTTGSWVWLSGGTLDANSSCEIELVLKIPSTIDSDITIENNAISVTGVTSDSVGFTGTSLSASDSIDIYIENIIFTKSYVHSGVAGNSTVANYKIENVSDSQITGINFSDDFNATLSGLVATGLPASDICGDGSILAGTSILALSNATLHAGMACDFNVTIVVPNTVEQGLYTDSKSKVYIDGIAMGSAVIADLKVGVLSDFNKTFSPSIIDYSEVSTLTYTIDNSLNEFNTTSLSFTDTLPTGLVIGTSPNTSKTCIDGTLVAVADSSTISYTGGSVLSSNSCTISVDVRSNTIGVYTSTSTALSTSFGTASTASDTLVVDNAPTLDAITNKVVLEDASDFNITLNAADLDNHSITYSIVSSDTSVANVNIVDGKIVISPVSNANGVISIEVNATANGLTATQNFDVNITAVNDTPVFSLSYGIININEATLTRISLENNISDADLGQSLSINAVSNDTDLANVVMDNHTLVVIPKEYKTGSFIVSLTLNDGIVNDTHNLNISILPINNPPQLENNITKADGSFITIPTASGTKPNYSSAYDYKEVLINGKVYAVYSDSDQSNKLSIMRKIDADNWEYVTGYQGFSPTAVSDINVKYSGRSKKLIIIYNNGTQVHQEIITAQELV